MRIFILLLSLVSFCLSDLSFPTLTGRVVDNANILSQSTKDNLQMILSSHEQKTTNQIVVATIKSLQGNSFEKYSLSLARHWGIGQKDKDNGVVLLIVPSEKKVRIEVGYGLEGVLTDAISHEIITDIIAPNFKNKDYDKGVLEAVQSIIKVINNKEVEEKTEEKSGITSDDVAVALIIWYFISLIGGVFALDVKNERVREVGASFGYTGLVMIILSLFLNAWVSIVVYIVIFSIFLSVLRKSGAGQGSIGGSSGGGGGSSGGGGYSGGGGSFGGGGSSGSW